MPFLDLNEGRIYYRQQGEGAPIVLVNDWPLSHNYWGPLAYRLRSCFRLIGFDPRSTGQSRTLSPTAPCDVETQAEDVHRIITRVGLGEVHLVGHGLGTVVAGLCLRAHPQDVRTLTLITPILRPDAPEGVNGYIAYTQAILMLRKLTAVPLARNLLLRRYSYGRIPSAYRRPLLEDFSRVTVSAAWETIHSATEEETLRRFAESLTMAKCPVLILACGEDKLSPLETARWIYERIGTGTLITMKTHGHFPMLESPEKIGSLLREFYEKRSPRASGTAS